MLADLKAYYSNAAFYAKAENGMGKFLLIGNGLNICLSPDVCTDKILEKYTCFTKKEIDVLKNQGMGFSSIIEASFEKNLNYDSVVKMFKSIKKDLSFLNRKENDVYRVAKENLQLIDGILTTNYDFAIEYNLFGCYPVKTKAIRRNCGYFFESNGKKVFHIHGDFNHDGNLCLGYFGYQKYLKSSMSNLSLKIKKDKDLFKKLEQKLPISLYKFLVDDIFILGLGITDSELIIWSILTFRRELIRRDLYSFCGVKQNTITIYECLKKENVDFDNYQKSLKRYYDSYFIEYNCEKLLDKTYCFFYKKCLVHCFHEIPKLMLTSVFFVYVITTLLNFVFCLSC